MNSFMSWVGGKKNLRDEVLARFPPYYERYIEVFGGSLVQSCRIKNKTDVV